MKRSPTLQPNPQRRRRCKRRSRRNCRPQPAQAEEAEVVPVVAPEPAAPVTQQMASPAEPPAEVNAGGGYGFLAASTDPDAKAPQSGEDVSSMMLMAKPIAAETATPPFSRSPRPRFLSRRRNRSRRSQPPPRSPPWSPPRSRSRRPPRSPPRPPRPSRPQPQPQPQPRSRPRPLPPSRSRPRPRSPLPRLRPKAKPPSRTRRCRQTAKRPRHGTDPNAAETADASALEPVPLTRRERRMLRKQQREYERVQQDPLLPWLR